MSRVGTVCLPIVKHNLFFQEQSEKVQEQLDDLMMIGTLTDFYYQNSRKHIEVKKKYQYAFSNEDVWFFSLEIHYDEEGSFSQLMVIPYGRVNPILDNISPKLIVERDIEVKDMKGTLISTNSISGALKVISALKESLLGEN